MIQIIGSRGVHVSGIKAKAIKRIFSEKRNTTINQTCVCICVCVFVCDRGEKECVLVRHWLNKYVCTLYTYILKFSQKVTTACGFSFRTCVKM